MRFIPIGIADSRCMDGFLNPSDYSDRYYDGVQLRKSPKNNLVLIMRSKQTAPMEWKVVYGFSSVFFHTFEEAADFCSKRGMTPVKGNTKTADDPRGGLNLCRDYPGKRCRGHTHKKSEFKRVYTPIIKTGGFLQWISFQKTHFIR